MKIVLASGIKGKIAEFKKLMPNDEVLAFKELIGNFEVEEDRDTFQGNAIKKAQEMLHDFKKQSHYFSKPREDQTCLMPYLA